MLHLLLGWQVHDIEDLAGEGRRVKGCPYYAARHFAEDAELVFCPYRRASPSLAQPLLLAA